MTVTKKQRAYAARLGRDQARFEQDSYGRNVGSAFPTYTVVFATVTGRPEARGDAADAVTLGDEWLNGYRDQARLFENCTHEFKASHALAVTELARCTHCHVAVMSGYLIPIEDTDQE